MLSMGTNLEPFQTLSNMSSQGSLASHSSMDTQSDLITYGTLQECYHISSTFLCYESEVLSAIARHFPKMAMDVYVEKMEGSFPNISPRWWIVVYNRPAHFLAPEVLKMSFDSGRFDRGCAITKTTEGPEGSEYYSFFLRISSSTSLSYISPLCSYGTPGIPTQVDTLNGYFLSILPPITTRLAGTGLDMSAFPPYGTRSTPNQVIPNSSFQSTLAPITTRSSAIGQDISASSSHGTSRTHLRGRMFSAAPWDTGAPITTRSSATSQDISASSSNGTPRALPQVDISNAPLQAVVQSTPHYAVSARSAMTSGHNRAGRGEIARTSSRLPVAPAAVPQGVVRATRGSTSRARSEALEARYRMQLGFPS